jgi:abequosyltransferase
MNREKMSTPQLSICIASMNRPSELLSLVSQLSQQINSDSTIEVIVVDSSMSRNESVAEKLSDGLGTYIWTGSPKGVDADFDFSIRSSQGRYCWVLPDDDRLVDGAVQNVLAATLNNVDLILVNTRVYDSTFEQILRPSTISLGTSEKFSGQVSVDDLAEFSSLLTYIGCVVVRRELWIQAVSSKYFGTEFVHVGVILSQCPITGLRIINEPQIEICYGQGYWEQRYVQVWWHNWERLIRAEVQNPDSVRRWGVPIGRKKIALTAYAKALRFVGNNEVRLRLQEESRGKAIDGFVQKLILATPAYALNILFSIAARIVNRQSTPVVLYDLRRRRDKRHRVTPN